MIVKRAVAKQGSVAGVLVLLFFLGGIVCVSAVGEAFEFCSLVGARWASRSACWFLSCWRCTATLASASSCSRVSSGIVLALGPLPVA